MHNPPIARLRALRDRYASVAGGPSPRGISEESAEQYRAGAEELIRHLDDALVATDADIARVEEAMKEPLGAALPSDSPTSERRKAIVVLRALGFEVKDG